MPVISLCTFSNVLNALDVCSGEYPKLWHSNKPKLVQSCQKLQKHLMKYSGFSTWNKAHDATSYLFINIF